MPRVLATKTNSTYNNPRLGYARVILFNDANGWELANNNNVPKNGEIFIRGNYEDDVDNKFEIGTLFETDIELVDNAENSTCAYSCLSSDITPPTKDTGLAFVYEISGSITPNRVLEINTPIRPSSYAFFSCVGDNSSREIVGPFEVASSRFLQTSRTWQVTFRIPSSATLASFGLEPHSLYRAAAETIPAGALIDLGNYSTDQGLIKASFNLGNELKIVNAPAVLFIDNRSLLGLVEETLTPNSRLGRKGIRELLTQIEASKSLKPAIKESGLKLLKDTIQIRDTLIEQLIDSQEISPKMGETLTSEDSEKLKKLETENEELTKQAQDLAARNQELEKINVSLDTGAVESLEKQIQENRSIIAELQSKIDIDKNYEKAVWELEKATTDLGKIRDETAKLEEVRSSLRRQIIQDDRAFRDKALEVIPFLNILSSSSEELDDVANNFSQNPSDYVTCDDNFIQVIAERIIKQGYRAKNDFLHCAIATAFSSRFIGVFGEPGTGKTTFARCFSKALGNEKKASTFINVGKGWTSHSEFIGFANTFIDKFKFQDEFFSQFTQRLENEANHPLRTAILDEASLSSVDSYLSDFMSIGNGFQKTEPDELNLSGKRFYFNADFRFLLTFNFDENTESLPKKFIDRMPLIHCELYDDEGTFEIKEEHNWKPLSGPSVVNFLSSMFLNENESRKDFLRQYGAFLEKWEPLGGLGQRKRMQIDIFLKLISLQRNVDEGFLIDFISQTFLLPGLSGQGAKYQDKLKKLAENVESLTARNALELMLENGERFQQYRYL